MFSSKACNLGGIMLVGLQAMACGSEEKEPNLSSWSISSPTITSGGEIPLVNTCDGRPFPVGSSPELNWTDGPEGTKSYALVLKHLAIVEGLPPTDPNYFKGFMWTIWDIPASVHKLPANLGRAQLPPEVPGSQQWAIRNQFGYFAPCPNADPAADPATRVTDRYGFTLYALNTDKVTLPAKEADVSNYTLTLTKHLDAVNIGTTELRAVSSAVASMAPTPVDATTLVYPVP